MYVSPQEPLKRSLPNPRTPNGCAGLEDFGARSARNPNRSGRRAPHPPAIRAYGNFLGETRNPPDRRRLVRPPPGYRLNEGELKGVEPNGRTGDVTRGPPQSAGDVRAVRTVRGPAGQTTDLRRGSDRAQSSRRARRGAV